VALFAGGRRAAWVCHLNVSGDTVRLYDVDSGAVLHSGYIEPDPHSYPLVLAGSPDGGQLLSSRSDGSVWLWQWPAPAADSP
jgi:hypothetical protein